MTVKIHKVITVLSARGSYASEVDVYYTEGIDKISDLKIRIYDSAGNIVKKVKKKEISDVSVYDGFSIANDLRSLSYTPTYSKYPYTIEYEYEEESKFTAFIPTWSPYLSFKNSVEYSKCKVNTPVGFDIRHLCKNLEEFKSEFSINKTSLLFEARELKAVEPESMMPYRNLPYVRFSPSNSVLDKTKVSYTDWESFGKWMYNSYLKDKNDLSESTVSEIEELVSGLENDFDKAKAIYDLAVNSTRYISIQLGEGGWEPFYAEETHERKYGDCKALSMYTLSMMEKAGLNPFYLVIYGESDYGLNLEEEFASIQGNHAIIGVPIDGDTIYADCTSSINPFGFRSGFTDGRIALAVDENGGKIIKTHKYEDTENLENTVSKIQVDPASRLTTLSVENRLEGLRISARLSVNQYSEKEIREDVYPSFYPEFKKETFEELGHSIIDEKTAVENFKIVSPNIIATAGDYLILPIHLHGHNLVKIESKARRFPIYIKDGYKKVNHYKIEIPEGYTYVEEASPIEIKSEFGLWKLEIQDSSESELRYSVTHIVKSGIFENELAEEYNTWLEEISKYTLNKITLKTK